MSFELMNIELTTINLVYLPRGHKWRIAKYPSIQTLYSAPSTVYIARVSVILRSTSTFGTTRKYEKMDLVLSQLSLSLRAYFYLLGHLYKQFTLAQKGLHTFSTCLLQYYYYQYYLKGLLVALTVWTLDRFHFQQLSGCYLKQRMLYTFTLTYLPFFNATFIKPILLAALFPSRST